MIPEISLDDKRRTDERRKKQRRRSRDRRTPVRVESRPGQRNTLQNSVADKLLSEIDDLELSVESQEGPGYSPYDSGSK